MRSCLAVFLLLLGLSMVVWMSWDSAGQAVDRFLEWWRGDRIVLEVTPQDTTRMQPLPEPLPPPIFPARQVAPRVAIQVSQSIDVPYRELGGSFDFNEVIKKYVDLMYYDTEVIIREDTIPSRSGVLFEVLNLEDSRVREFYMWDTFNLTIHHELQLPNSVLRVYLDLTGVYREQPMPGGWSATRSQQIRSRMTKVLESDAEHLLLFLDNKLRREVGSFIAW